MDTAKRACTSSDEYIIPESSEPSTIACLPPEILSIILVEHCGEYAPALREVCTEWRQIIQNSSQPLFIIPANFLALCGHSSLLEDIFQRQAPRCWNSEDFTKLPDSPTLDETHRRIKRVRIADANREMACAAYEGHEAIVRLCVKYGGTNFNGAAIEAAKGGHEAIFRFCKERGVVDFNQAMAYAAAYGREAIVRLCKEYGVVAKSTFDHAMANSARAGHESIFQLCLEYGATDYNWAMATAAYGGRVEIVRKCKELGATNFNFAMEQAAIGGHESVIWQCIEYGATGFEEALTEARIECYDSIVCLFEKLIKERDAIVQ